MYQLVTIKKKDIDMDRPTHRICRQLVEWIYRYWLLMKQQNPPLGEIGIHHEAAMPGDFMVL